MDLQKYIDAQSQVIDSMGRDIELLKDRVKFHKQVRNWVIIIAVIAITLISVL